MLGSSTNDLGNTPLEGNDLQTSPPESAESTSCGVQTLDRVGASTAGSKVYPQQLTLELLVTPVQRLIPVRLQDAATAL